MAHEANAVRIELDQTKADAAATFGLDIWCQDSMRAGRKATGVLLVAQNAYHRLITPRGMLRGGDDEANYGFDLSAAIGSASTPSDRAALPGKIQNELLKDARITDVVAMVTSSTDSAGLVTQIVSVRALTDEGPFDLVIGVGAVTVELLKLDRGAN